MPDGGIHPTAQVLALFGHGELSDVQAATIAAHLETCLDCRKAVAGLAPDTFLGKVRAAGPGPAPGSTVTSASSGGERSAGPPPADLPPELANHPKFHIVRELGRGGMGVIYLAEHRILEKRVAIKVISPAVLDNPDAVARFLTEARAAGKLDHPNIARAFDADQAGGLYFLVLEYVEGVSLAQVLERQGPLSVANACHCIRQAALGLQHAFEQGMVHRDIKPHNLMLTPKGQIKILDFGLARMRGPRPRTALTQVDTFMGTPQYVAPEQATDARMADTRADIYSLGCTLFAVLAGRPPFVEDTAVKLVLAQIGKDAPPLHQVRPDVPPALSALVARMLAKDPARRYQRPIEVAQALTAFVRPTVGSAPRTVPTATAVPAKTAPANEVPVAWDKLVDEPVKRPAAPARAHPRRRVTGKTLLKLGAVFGVLALATLLLGFVALWAGGVFRAKAQGAGGGEPPADVDEPLTLVDEAPRIAVQYHDVGDSVIRNPSMRFGLVMLQEEDRLKAGQKKKLTYDLLGRSNNTCVKIDGGERLFGENEPTLFPEPPGHWEPMKEPLGAGRPWTRAGAKSTWVYDDVKIAIAQTVEIIPGEQSRLLDTCLVRYRIQNRDNASHGVGLRVLLDTYIGSNDGVPFTIPGLNSLCDTTHTFNGAAEVPDFIQALENPVVPRSSAIAHLQFRLGGNLEVPSRVTLGAWPDKNLGKFRPQLAARLRQQLTGWEVPVVPMRTISPPDSAVVIYWDEQPLPAQAVRDLGFTYGLGHVVADEGGGKLAVTAGGLFEPGVSFTVTAYARDPQRGQRLTLTVPDGFEIRDGKVEQAVPPLPANANSPISPVSWKVRTPPRAGKYTFVVQSSSGERQSLVITLRRKRVFD
jgi:predicted Ser/Thr protein kinase